MRVATIQTCPTFKDKPANLRRALELVIQAAKAGAELIALPELCTTGYSFMSHDDAAPFAENIDLNGTTFRLFKQAAEELGVHLVWGMMEQDLGSGDLYNSQVYVGPDGFWASYRKINPFGNDYLWAKPGRSNPPVIKAAFKDGSTRKLGMLVCRDVRDKKDSKWTDFYEKGDADVVILSSAWGDGGFPATTWMDFAKDNDCTLIVSNRWGKEIPNDFGEGGICVIWPDGRVVCDGLAWNQDCIVYAEV